MRWRGISGARGSPVRHDLSGAVKRRREKRSEDQALEADEFVTASEESEAGEEPVQDYYEPSGPTEESE